MWRLHEETLKEGISRRRILRTGMAVLPQVIVGRALLPGRQAAAQQKAAKQQVQYRETPKAGFTSPQSYWTKVYWEASR